MTEHDSTPADAAPADTTPQAKRPRLMRSRNRKVVAGVCDGAGRYFDIDPVIFRVVLTMLALAGGAGLIIYGMGWLIIPLEGEDESEAHRLLSGRIEGTALSAVLVALVGCGLYASMLGNGGNQAFSLLLLAALAGALYRSQQLRTARRDGEPGPVAATAEAPPAVQAPPTPGTTSWWREPLTKEPPGGIGAGGSGYLWGPDDGPYQERTSAVWREWRHVRCQGEGSWLGVLVFFLAVAAAAIGSSVRWHTQPLGTSLEIGLGCALAVFGMGFVVSSLVGRARGGTVFAAVVTTALLVGAAALPKSIGTEWTEKTWHPVGAAEVETRYELGAGQGTLDLTSLSLAGKTVSTTVDIGAGRAEVRLPAHATVVLDYHIGVGDVRLPGVEKGGVDITAGESRRVTIAPAAGAASTGTIELHAEVGIGQLKVVR